MILERSLAWRAMDVPGVLAIIHALPTVLGFQLHAPTRNPHEDTVGNPANAGVVLIRLERIRGVAPSIHPVEKK